jgi:hypothetical protein
MPARAIDGKARLHVPLVRVRVHVGKHRAAQPGRIEDVERPRRDGQLASALSVTSSGFFSPAALQ